MDGVFMLKFIKVFLIAVLVVVLIYGITVGVDKYSLQQGLLRLHVVANSDSEADQQIKLQVRDAVIATLQEDMDRVGTKEQAQALISSKLEKLERVANNVLAKAGVEDKARVTLEREAFETREYDTFTLPAGVYDSLRITIGEGQGKNWWCVVFPSLCVGAASEDVEDTAEDAGLSYSLSCAITGRREYRVRFFLLECIGRIENYFAK